MVTKSGFDSRKIEAARQVYAAMRNINLAGGRALEAHERVALLTVPAGLRSFCFLNHIEETDFYLASAVLPTFGLHCGPCQVKLRRWALSLAVELQNHFTDVFQQDQRHRPRRF